jgi:hypothetical protein
VRESRLIALLVLVFGAPAAAQDAPRVGELVEARMIRPRSQLTGGSCSAPVAAFDGDTLVLAAQWSCPRGSYAADLRVARGDNGSRLTHAVLGLIAGAVIGGVIARSSVGDGCVNGACDVQDAGYVSGAATAAGVALGALLGTVAGVALPAGRRWVDVGRERPIRVGWFDLHPMMRVSLVERLR